MKEQNEQMSEQAISACSDIFIKYLFGSEGNNDILIAFINAVLDEAGHEKAVTVQVKNPFNIKEYFGDKESILDVKATDAKGRIFDIEVQTSNFGTFVNRSLYYWADLYAAQINDADQYKRRKPVICINILTQNILPGDKYFNSFELKEQTTGQTLTQDLSINYIELRKLISVHFDKPLDRLSLYLKNEGKKDKQLEALIDTDPILKKAHENYTRFSEDDKLREIYKDRLKFLRDKEMFASAAREAREEGFLEGNTKGKQQGILEGRKEGIIKVAKNLKTLNLSIEQILESTGLTREEIDEI